MKKLFLTITVLAAIGLGGCKKGFLDETANPNAPSSATLQQSLSGAEKGAADIVNNWGSYTGSDNLYAEIECWVGYMANPQGYVADSENIDYVFGTTSAGPWTDLYNNLSNVNILQTNATGVNGDYQAIAMILKVYDFQQLVDLYGNVPYTQALLGVKNLTPSYDNAETVIYPALIAQCDAAIALITSSTSATPPAGDDIIFGGNMTNWQKFANSLKLRLILRQSNLSNFSTIYADMSKTASIGFIDGTSGSAAANPGYALSDAYGGQESPFYREYGIKPNNSTSQFGYYFYHANAYDVSLMRSLNDTLRLQEFYLPVNSSTGGTGTNSTQVVGIVLGGAVPAYTSAIGPALLGPGTGSSGQGASESAILMSASESLFLEAEAAHRGVLPGGDAAAATFYNSGITASFEQVSAYGNPLADPDASAAAYYAQPSVAYNAANAVQQIITQKYISLTGFGVTEAFAEYRRTGYPAIPASVDPSTLGGGLLPARLIYPQIEYSANNSNVSLQAPPTPTSEFSAKIFWAK